MGLIDRLRHRENVQAVTQDVYYSDDKAGIAAGNEPSSDSDTLSIEARAEREVEEHPDAVTADAQLGQQKVESVAIVWTRPALFATYAWIWLCFFVLALQSSILSNVSYVSYSDFSSAPAINTAYILSSVIAGVLKLPLGKTLNLWGRAEGFLVTLLIYVIGLIIIASSTGPNAWAAGYVLYSIGYGCMYYLLQVFIADTSGLRHRAFAWAFAATPFICTAFTGSLAADAYLANSTWQWAIGTFCIILPVIFIPLAFVFKFYERKAQKMGLWVRTPSGRTVMQSIWHYLIEFDVMGCFILMAAFILFLLPFSLQTYGEAPYDSATFIVMVVLGVCLFPVFYIWERYFARVTFIRWQLLRDRTVLGACISAATTYYSFYCWDAQFYNFILVVYNLSVTYTGYVTSIYDVGSCFWGVVFGLYVWATKHFKYFCLFFGLPLLILGAGLMIKFRGQDADLGLVIMCQIFIAFGGGTLVIGQEMAGMAAADHDGVPVVLALINLSNSIGGAIGQAVAAAIYGNVFPAALNSALPESDRNLTSSLYLNGYPEQIMYAPGTPVRDACDYAWGQVQKWESVSSTAVLALAIPALAVWKNYNVDRRQNKGTLL